MFPPGCWWATAHVLLGLPLGILTFAVTLVFTALTAGLAITAILALGIAPLLLLSVRGFTAMQRSRFRSLLGVEIPDVRERREGPRVRRMVAELRSGALWRQLGYHLVALPIGVLGSVVVSVAWSCGLAGSTVVAYSGLLPRRGSFDLPMRAPAILAALTGAGLLLLAAAPRLSRAVANVDTATARVLLGPSRAQALSLRMQALASSRAGVVDAADAQRRRIERDLHDGTQQRLVSLALHLGMARAELADAPPEARQAIARAHDEAKQALAELRDFVRGLHPAVLDDRGLDAALSGIAARAPLPVRLRVDVPDRCSPTVEAVAYFVVSESLANVAKHARASQVEVTVRRTGDRLLVRVADDGVGGAGTQTGSGLRGLAQRAASVDGVLRVDSPPGGPTVIEVELPCES
ncbi:MAG: hypothetical protein V7603_6855 [Micromonosporaceae bacterium]